MHNPRLGGVRYRAGLFAGCFIAHRYFMKVWLETSQKCAVCTLYSTVRTWNRHKYGTLVRSKTSTPGFGCQSPRRARSSSGTLSLHGLSIPARRGFFKDHGEGCEAEQSKGTASPVRRPARDSGGFLHIRQNCVLHFLTSLGGESLCGICIVY